MIPQSTAKKYRRNPTEVFALTFDDRKGTIANQQGFPIEIKTTPTGETILDTFLGPMPVIKIEWIDPHTKETRECEVPHNTVIIVRIREYYGVYRGLDEGELYLEFMDFDEFYGKYEEMK